ncbi:MAG: flagellar hook protein FlgE [Alkalilacustris sp.]
MSISSSMNAGVAGLSANATRLSTISDNIANSSTFGYKRMTADFASVVLADSPGSYSAGGVRVSTSRIIDQRGPLNSTSNPTDIAIAGRGMLPVTTQVAAQAGGALPMLMTTTGSFRPDANGILRTDSGLVLLGIPANIDGTIPPFARDVSTALQPVQVNANQFVGNPTTFMDIGVNLPATATRVGAEPVEYPLTVELFDSVGVGTTMSATFSNTIPPSAGVGLVPDAAAGRLAANTWLLTLDNIEGAPPVQEALVVFGPDGRLQEFRPVSRPDPTDPTSVLTPAGAVVTVDPTDPDSGSLTFVFNNPNTNPDLEVRLDQVAGGRGLTQLSDRFTPINIEKDGSPVGDLISVEVDARGMVNAIYDNGFTRTIFQVPIVDVPNLNGLTALSNQTYRPSRDSGQFFLWNAGEGPVGEMVGFAREESAVDVAQELTSLIQTQRAYSSNAKVIQTVDEMLQETTNLKR